MDSSPLFREILSCVSIRQRLVEQEVMIGCEFDMSMFVKLSANEDDFGLLLIVYPVDYCRIVCIYWCCLICLKGHLGSFSPIRTTSFQETGTSLLQTSACISLAPKWLRAE